MDFLLPIIGIEAILLFLFYLRLKELRNDNKALEKDNKELKDTSWKLKLIIHHFFLEEINLSDASKLSREFFTVEDLKKHDWEKTSGFSIEEFYEIEKDGPELITTHIINEKITRKGYRGLTVRDEISDSEVERMNKEAIEFWLNHEKEETLQLMVARINFFNENFSKVAKGLIQKNKVEEDPLDNKVAKDLVNWFAASIRDF